MERESISIKTDNLTIKATNISQESLTQILDFTQSHRVSENKRKEQAMKRDSDFNFQALTLGLFLSSFLGFGTYQFIHLSNSTTTQSEVQNVK